MSEDKVFESFVVDNLEDITRNQDARTSSTKIVMDVMVVSFLWQEKGKPQEERAEIPPSTTIKFKNEKGDMQSFEPDIKFKGRLITVHPCEGGEVVEQNGGTAWDVMTKVSYKDGVVDFLKENPEAAVPFKKNGSDELLEKRPTTLYSHSIYNFYASGKDGSVFRKKMADGIRNQVRPGTILRLFDVKPTEDVLLPAGSHEGVAKRVNSYKNFKAMSVYLSIEDDSTKPLSEIWHNIEQKNAHPFVPVEKLRQGDPAFKPDYTPYIYYGTQYHTVEGETPFMVFYPIPSQSDDFIFYRNDTKVYEPKFILRAMYGQRQEDGQMEKYVLKIFDARKNRAHGAEFGITDPQIYDTIMRANGPIWCHIKTQLWKKISLELESNGEGVQLKDPLIKGFYNLGVSEVVPDYFRWLKAFGIPISKERVLEEFEDFMVEDTRRNITTLLLTGPPASQNMLHAAGGLLGSFVLNLGTKDGCGIEGDIYPILDRCRFYAVTNRAYTEEELVFPASSPTEGDEFFKSISAVEGFVYQIFAIQDLAQEPIDTRKLKSAASSKKSAGRKRK